MTISLPLPHLTSNDWRRGGIRVLWEIGVCGLPRSIYICVCACLVHGYFSIWSEHAPWIRGLKAVCEGSHRLSYQAVHYVSPPWFMAPNSVNNGLAGDAKLLEIRLLCCGLDIGVYIKRCQHIGRCAVCSPLRPEEFEVDSFGASGARVSLL